MEYINDSLRKRWQLQSPSIRKVAGYYLLLSKVRNTDSNHKITFMMKTDRFLMEFGLEPLFVSPQNRKLLLQIERLLLSVAFDLTQRLRRPIEGITGSSCVHNFCWYCRNLGTKVPICNVRSLPAQSDDNSFDSFLY